MARLILPNGTNVDLIDSIYPGGNFYWYEATRGGDRVPRLISELNGIFSLAKEAEKARLAIGEAMIVTSWYRPKEVNDRIPGAARNSQHVPGRAMDFYCNTLSPIQIYRILDEIWNGGLGLYGGHVHLDVRGFRMRF